MRVYIVLLDDGSIYNVRKSKKRAEEDKARLESRYECHSTIKECIVN